MKALADKADKWCRQDALAAEQHYRELAKCAAALVKLVSAAERCRQELADCTAVLAKTTLANEHCCLEVAERGAMLGETVLAKERCCFLSAAQATELALATAQVMVLADLVLPKRFRVCYHRPAMRR